MWRREGGKWRRGRRAGREQAALTRPSSEADGGLATQSPASSRRGLRVPTPHRRRRTAAAAAAQPSSCVRADLLPPQPQPQPPRTASAPTPRRRGLTPPRHPYLRLGSSRPCPSALPATKRGGGPNYESRQRPRDTPTPIPAAVFPGADGSRSSEARSNRKRLGLPAGSGRRRRSRRRSAAPPVTRWGRGGGASSRDSAAAGVVLAAVLRSRGASRCVLGPRAPRASPPSRAPPRSRISPYFSKPAPRVSHLLPSLGARRQ